VISSKEQRYRLMVGSGTQLMGMHLSCAKSLDRRQLQDLAFGGKSCSEIAISDEQSMKPTLQYGGSMLI